MTLFRRKRDHSPMIFDCLELSERELHEIKTLVEEHGGKCGVDNLFAIKFINRSKYNETSHRFYRLYDIDFIPRCIEKSKILNLNDYRLGPKYVSEVCATSTFLNGVCYYAKTLCTVQESGNSIVPDSPLTSDYDVDVEGDCTARVEDSLMSDFSSPSVVESSQKVDTKEAESSKIVDPLVKIPSNESQSVITGAYERRLSTFGAGGDASSSENTTQNCPSITGDSQGLENWENLESAPQETPLNLVTVKPKTIKREIGATVFTDLRSLDLKTDVIETRGDVQKLGKRGEPPLGTLNISRSFPQEIVLPAKLTVDISESLNVTEDLAGNITIDISDSSNVSEDTFSPAKVPLDAESLTVSKKDVFEANVGPDVVDSSNVSQENVAQANVEPVVLDSLNVRQKNDVQANVEPDVVDSSNVRQENVIQVKVEPDVLDSSNVSQENVIQANVQPDVLGSSTVSQENVIHVKEEPDVVDSSNVRQENVIQVKVEPGVLDSSNVSQENVIQANVEPDVLGSSTVSQENVIHVKEEPDVVDSSNVRQENVIQVKVEPDVLDSSNVSQENVIQANVEPDVLGSSTVSQENVIHVKKEPDVSDSSSADKENVIPSNIELDVSESSNVSKQGASSVRSDERKEADKKSPDPKDVEMTVVETSSPAKLRKSTKRKSWISCKEIVTKKPHPETTKDTQQEEPLLKLRRDAYEACPPIRKPDKLVNPPRGVKKVDANLVKRTGPETDAKPLLKELNQLTCVPENGLNNEDFRKAGPSGIQKTNKTSSRSKIQTRSTASEDTDELNGTRKKNRRSSVQTTMTSWLSKTGPQGYDDCLQSDDPGAFKPTPSCSRANGGGTIVTVIDLTIDDEEELPVGENKKCGSEIKNEKKRRRRLEDSGMADETSDSEIEATATPRKKTCKPDFIHIDDSDSDARNPNDDDSSDSVDKEPERANDSSQTRQRESLKDRTARLERDLFRRASPHSNPWIAGLDARPNKTPTTYEKFTEAERRAMIDYLLSFDNIIAQHPKGYNVWKRMLDTGILPGRTVQSVHNHFQKYLLPNITEYSHLMTESQIMQFRQLQRTRRGR